MLKNNINICETTISSIPVSLPNSKVVVIDKKVMNIYDEENKLVESSIFYQFNYSLTNYIIIDSELNPSFELSQLNEEISDFINDPEHANVSEDVRNFMYFVLTQYRSICSSKELFKNKSKLVLQTTKTTVHSINNVDYKCITFYEEVNNLDSPSDGKTNIIKNIRTIGDKDGYFEINADEENVLLTAKYKNTTLALNRYQSVDEQYKKQFQNEEAISLYENALSILNQTDMNDDNLVRLRSKHQSFIEF